jgi:uncharacterized FlaG/YvyC family protein
MPEINTKTCVRQLPCNLTEDEVRLRGIDLAHANTQYADTKDEAKSKAKAYKDRLEKIYETIHDLKDAVRNGVEVRPVECDVLLDHYAGMVTITRRDTGDIVESRRMTPAESQGRLDLDK